ncbi:MAG: YjbE family putative metal transport protein [Desulfotomaculales bacterium]
MEFLNTTTLWAVFSIIVADLVLAGDNALLIGLACRGLPPELKRRAVVWGVAGAVVLRIFFTSIVVYLMQVPFLRAAGGLVLGWIALKLLVRKEETVRVNPAENFAGAVKTIVMADLVMSFDNMLAVAGAARGHIELVVFGLLLSLPLLFLGSQIIAWLVERYPVFLYVGAGVLTWVAGTMVAEDPAVHSLLVPWAAFDYLIPLAVTAVILPAGWYLRRAAQPAPRAAEPGRQTDPPGPRTGKPAPGRAAGSENKSLR